MTAQNGKSKSFILWIAWRNMVSGQKKSGLSFMTIVSVVGVAVGVAALIIVLSVMGGFEADLKSKMLRGRPHLEIVSDKVAAGFSLEKHPVKRFDELFPEATAVEPFTKADVVLKQGRHLTSATLFGVDPDRKTHLWGFGEGMTEGSLEAIGEKTSGEGSGDSEARYPGMVVGSELAVQLGVEVGDVVTAVSPQAGAGSALGGGTISRPHVIVGKFHTGLFDYDAKWAVVSLSDGRKFMPDYAPFLDVERYVSGVAINLAEPMEVDTLESRFEAQKRGSSEKPSLEGLEALTWKEANKSLLFALKLEKFAMGSILMLIVVVAAFSISGTMMMTVFHKRGQVSLLRSLGMSQRDIARLYLTHGFTIGTVGIIAGVAAGLAVCALIKSFQFIPLPAGVYQLKALPCKWLWVDYAVICVCAWLFSLGAATYPAMTAARQDPGRGLRYL